MAGDLREQVLNQLVALDLNSNGQLEPTEANSLSATIMRQLGLDPGRSIYLETLRTLVNQVDLDTIPFETDAGLQAEGERSSFEFPSVRDRQRGRGEGLNFGGVENPILSDTTPMTERYSALVLEEVRSLLFRYDENRSGVLDPSEIALVPWSTPNPLESDLDQDGRLTDVELAERLKTMGTVQGTESRRSRRSRTRSSEGGATEEDPRAAERAAAEAERERRAEERKQRERERRNAGPTDRVATYVKDLIGKLDKDTDGKLTLEEVSEMRNPPPKTADADGDGILTYDELYGYYGDGQSPSGSSSSRGSNSSRSSSSDRGPLTGTIRWDGELGAGAEQEDSAWPADLARKDQNNDRMISLAEFSADLTDDDRQAFGAWDINGDGYITLSETQQAGSRNSGTRGGSDRGQRDSSRGERSGSSFSRRGSGEAPAESSSTARRRFGSSRGASGTEQAEADSESDRSRSSNARDEGASTPASRSTSRGSTSRGSTSRGSSSRGDSSSAGSEETVRSRSSQRSGMSDAGGRSGSSNRGVEQAPPANALRYSIFGN